MSNELTRYGFNFGSMSVTRTAEDDKGVTIVSVTTQKSKFSVRATKTGFIRFYDNQGNECELVNKDYIEQLEIKVQ